MSNETNTGFQQIADELAAIRKLLILSLIRSGVSQEEVATALGISQASISRMFLRTKKRQ